MEDQCKNVPTPNPTLMDAYGRLLESLDTLDGVVELSNKLQRKFNRTDGMVRTELEEGKAMLKEEQPHKDIVALFLNIADKLNNKTQSLGMNISDVVDRID